MAEPGGGPAGSSGGLEPAGPSLSSEVSTQRHHHHRPIGTRRRQLEWLTNFVLVVVSLLGVSVGSGLLAFYKLHLMRFIAMEFYVVPLILLVGGLFTLLVSLMGLIATARKSPCLLICYSFFLLLAFMILVAGIACSIRIIFVVYMDIDRTLALPLLKRYGFDSYATSTWDTLQESYRCCGADTSFNIGYDTWKDNEFLAQTNSLPNSCCLYTHKNGEFERDRCGESFFEGHDAKYMASYVTRIYVHGCMIAIDSVLRNQVVHILMVFAIVGTLMALIELLGVVLACALAQVISKQKKEKKREKVRRMNRKRSSMGLASEEGTLVEFTDTRL